MASSIPSACKVVLRSIEANSESTLDVFKRILGSITSASSVQRSPSRPLALALHEALIKLEDIDLSSKKLPYQPAAQHNQTHKKGI